MTERVATRRYIRPDRKAMLAALRAELGYPSNRQTSECEHETGSH